jgi:hypothetical protein
VRGAKLVVLRARGFVGMTCVAILCKTNRKESLSV